MPYWLHSARTSAKPMSGTSEPHSTRPQVRDSAASAAAAVVARSVTTCTPARARASSTRWHSRSPATSRRDALSAGDSEGGCEEAMAQFAPKTSAVSVVLMWNPE